MGRVFLNSSHIFFRFAYDNFTLRVVQFRPDFSKGRVSAGLLLTQDITPGAMVWYKKQDTIFPFLVTLIAG